MPTLSGSNCHARTATLAGSRLLSHGTRRALPDAINCVAFSDKHNFSNSLLEKILDEMCEMKKDAARRVAVVVMRQERFTDKNQ